MHARLSLDARAARRPHDRGVRRPRGEDHPVAGTELDRTSVRRELDRAGDAVEDLRERMEVPRVAIARSVRPAVDAVRLGAQAFLDTHRRCDSTAPSRTPRSGPTR